MARWRGGEKSSPVYRITGARQSLEEDVQERQRRYLVAMVIRTAAVLLTVLLWNVSLPLAVVALALGVALPYVAVVVANAGRENGTSVPAGPGGPSATPPLPPAQQDAHNRS